MPTRVTHPDSHVYRLVFLFPEVYRPLAVNFAGEFMKLSPSCTGYIFTLCSDAYRHMPISHFRLYSGRITSSSIGNFLRRLWIQTALACWIVLRGPCIHAIVTWDPYTSGLSGVFLKFLLRTKLIVQIVGDYHRMDPTEDSVGDPKAQNRIFKQIKKALMRSLFRLTVSLADAVKVINTDLERFIRHTYPRKPVFRFPCYVATGYFQSLPTFQGDYLLSIGHPFYRKGVDILIQAFKLVVRKHPHVRLRIMGYSPENELQTYRLLAANDPHIEFVRPGWIEDVAEQLRGCYALVHAARSEAMGRVLFEAMACRKAVVSTRTNGGIEYIEDGRSGILCEIENVADLAEKMNHLLADHNLATRMGQVGYERVVNEFSEEKYVSSFRAMLRDILTDSVEQLPIERRTIA